MDIRRSRAEGGGYVEAYRNPGRIGGRAPAAVCGVDLQSNAKELKMSNDLQVQAPWVGYGEQDYYDRICRREIIGYCNECGKAFYDEDEIYDDYLCEDCYCKLEEEEYAGL